MAFLQSIMGGSPMAAGTHTIFTVPLLPSGEAFPTHGFTFHVDPEPLVNVNTFSTFTTTYWIAPEKLDSAAVVYDPEIGNIVPDLYTDADFFYDHTLTLYLVPDAYADADSIYEPSLYWNNPVLPELLGSGVLFPLGRIFNINSNRVVVAQRPCDPPEGRIPSPSERARTILTRRSA